MKHLVQQYLREHPKPARARYKVFCEHYGISPATMRRRLREQGATWQRLYDAEIKRRIHLELPKGKHASEIGEAMGYTCKNSFYRIARRVCGDGYLRSRLS